MTTPQLLINELHAADHRPPFRRSLLVEDEASLRKIVARNLTSRGMQVSEAGSAAEKFVRPTAERPDLLLLDINLPD